MKKRNWTIHIPGKKPFQMVSLDGELTESEALAEARAIWPLCTVS